MNKCTFIAFLFCFCAFNENNISQTPPFIANPVSFAHPQVGQHTEYRSVTIDRQYNMTIRDSLKEVDIIDTVTNGFLVREITWGDSNKTGFSDTLLFPLYFTDTSVFKPLLPYSPIFAEFALREIKFTTVDSTKMIHFTLFDIANCLVGPGSTTCFCGNEYGLTCFECNGLFFEIDTGSTCLEFPILYGRTYKVERQLFQGVDDSNNMCIYSLPMGIVAIWIHWISMIGLPDVSDGWIQTWPENTIFPE